MKHAQSLLRTFASLALGLAGGATVSGMTLRTPFDSETHSFYTPWSTVSYTPLSLTLQLAFLFGVSLWANLAWPLFSASRAHLGNLVLSAASLFLALRAFQFNGAEDDPIAVPIAVSLAASSLGLALAAVRLTLRRRLDLRH